jgi:PAS domain S-box-containing protein
MASLKRNKDLRDVNERLVLSSLSAQEAAEQAAAFKLLVGSVQDYAIFMLDPHGYVTSWNVGAERINGYAPTEIIGKHFSVFYPGGDVDGNCERELASAAAEGRYEAEGQRVRKDGSQYWANAVITALHDESGMLVGFGKAIRDLTEKLRVDEERISLARAQEAKQRNDEFLAIMGHELRNPLAPIVAVVDLLKLREGLGIDRELVILDRQVQRMSSLVDDLLDTARVLGKPIPLKRKVVAVSDLVRQAMEVAAPLIVERGHRLLLDTGSTQLTVDVDPDRMAQVFDNLLTNAAKYTDPGGEIRVRTLARGEQIHVEFEDTGIGIPADLMPRLFDLFTQGKRDSDRRAGGLGIGLAVAHRLVSEHGGELSAFSAGEGQGSCFSVRLPRSAEVDLGSSNGKPLRRCPAAPQATRVLIVEDNQDAAATLSVLLVHLGHETRIAFDSPQALQLAQEFEPEVIFSDIGLPGMDGYELVRRLRRLPMCANIPIVAVSGYSRVADRQHSLQAGFTEHFTKPVPLERLFKVLETVIHDG